jgi:hypothetical protein
LQNRATLMISATVLPSCSHTSRSSFLAELQANGAPPPATFTVSCTPGSGKLYTARIENDGKTQIQPQNGATSPSLSTADSDASTRVFTISNNNTADNIAWQTRTRSVDGQFIKLSLNY